MPRDLFGRDPKDEAQLTASPESQNSYTTSQDGHKGFSIDRGDEGFGLGPSRNAKMDNKALSDLHPYVQILSLSDVDSCVALENATFPENERCSREKFIYRLTTCPELSLGLFSTTTPDGPGAALPTYSHSRPPDSASPTKKSTLVAQVIATKCASTTVTDESMEYPSHWRNRVSLSDRQGHQEHGRTIAIHSLAALPEFKGRGLGKIVMRSYMQRMESSGIADRIVLLAHDHLIDYYAALGFRNTGKSEVQFGGGEWVNMSYTITESLPGS
ncbi:MAG: hypothetical protein L6R42_007983 [Xanthoria sp. 1 TBL-2021]|nr:MAG: hypothetical protein L6R42_007983 [Xanthoria sp. 1 TBL-2021]